MIIALAMRGVHPTNIHTVIITHGHPDHFGGGGLFPSAQFIFGPYLYRGDQFRFSGLNMVFTKCFQILSVFYIFFPYLGSNCTVITQL